MKPILDGSSTADLVIEWPEECKQSFMQPSTQSSITAVNSGVIAAIALAIITILAVGGAIGVIILVYQRKTTQKMNKNE